MSDNMQEYTLDFTATVVLRKPDVMNEAELLVFAKKSLDTMGLLGVKILRLDATPACRN